MKAVILAAGVGSRLKSITHIKPKCLIEINGIPIIKRQIDILLNNDIIEEIIIIIGYKAEMIMNFIETNYEDKPISLVENTKYLETNNMYSLYLAKEYVNGRFILMNGDIVIEPSLFDDFLRFTHEDAIAVDVENYYEESMKVIQHGDYLLGISKSYNNSESLGCSIDLYKFSEKGKSLLFSFIKNFIEHDKKMNQWTEIAIHKLISKGILKMKAADIGCKKWVEIDDINDLIKAEKLFNENLDHLRDSDVFFFDLDGTTYIEDELFDGVPELIEILRSQGKKFYFLSNNSSCSTNEYLRKLTGLGLNVTLDNIILSQHPTMRYLKNNHYHRIFLLGTSSLKEEFENNGFILTDEDPEVVVLGFDKELTYEKLVKASTFLQDDIHYIATHLDKKCPVKNGFIPDAGSFAALIKETTNKWPLVLGKPNKEMLLFKLNELGYLPEDAVMVGDRLYTDMKMGKEANVTTICVLTGESSREDIEFSDIKPDIILEGISDLIEILTKGESIT